MDLQGKSSTQEKPGANQVNRCAIAIIFSSAGAAFGTAKSGIGIAGIGPYKPELITRSLLSVVMSGILAVYGLVVSVLVSSDLTPDSSYSLYKGFMHLGCGLTVGFASLAAGYAIGMVGDEGTRQLMKENRLFVGLTLILIFSEVTALYGLIVALILNSKASS